MIRFLNTVLGAILAAVILTIITVLAFGGDKPTPAKPEMLTCVRVKEVTPAGTINYLCEVRK